MASKGDNHNTPYVHLMFICGVIKDGRLVGLTSSACKVWAVLLAHADFKTRTCFPSLTTIAELAGVDKGTVTRATNELEAAGLIERKRGGGRESTRYTLIAPGAPAQPVADEQTPLHTPSPDVDATAHVAQAHPDQSRRRDTNINQGTVTTEHHPTTRDAAVIANELERLGIKEPKRSALIKAHPELTVPIIRKLAERSQTAQNPAGCLVHLIETEGADLSQKAQKAAEAEVRADAEREARRRERADADRKRKQEEQDVDTWIAGLPDDEVDRLKAKACMKYPGRAGTWKDIDPRAPGHLGLKYAMQEIAEKEADS